MLNDVLMKELADVEFNTLDAMEFEIFWLRLVSTQAARALVLAKANVKPMHK